MAILGQILGYAGIAFFALMITVEVAFRASNVFWFFSRLLWGRLSLQKMRNRNGWF